MLDIIDVSPYKNIDIKTFQTILDESLTTSYKLLWFKGILEEVSLNKREILFEDIVVRMLISAWAPINKYKLNFGTQDQMTNIINDIATRFSIPSDITKDKLINILQKNKFNMKNDIRLLCKYVPYRLLTPFYKNNLSGSDYQRQKQIIELNASDKNPLYKINISNSSISIVDDEWFSYLYSNQKLMLSFVNYKLINYVQRKNLSIPAIPLKMDFVSKRELATPTKLWKEYLKTNFSTDIYTTGQVDIENLSLDHFLPWSFVMHDELWNLIPTQKNINSSKNDKLPTLKSLLDIYCLEQYNFAIWLKEQNYKKALESYLQIDINLFNESISKTEFIEKLKATIIPLHQIASNQGFETWDSSIYLNSLKVKEVDTYTLLSKN